MTIESFPSYDPTLIERQVQDMWEKQHAFLGKEEGEGEKFYCLSMIPYPSGALHMGHVRNYTLGDVIARYHRMQGKRVLHPMGWDAFGLPAENAAIEHQRSPADWTDANIAQMRTQLKRFGFSFDWSRELRTDDPAYYRWEQWFFLQLYEKGIAYKAVRDVHWCPRDHTVLANEQVVEGRCWRCAGPVERKPLSQWFLKLSAYAEPLLEGLAQLPHWPEEVKQMQRHWIGKEQGWKIRFAALSAPEDLTLFTPTPELLFGVTYLVVSGEHPLARAAAQDSAAVADFLKTSTPTRDLHAARGVKTPYRFRHPLSGAELTLWISELSAQRSGGEMALPAHQDRDTFFAERYGLTSVTVIEEGDPPRLIHSASWNQLPLLEAREAIVSCLVASECAQPSIHYALQDWIVSRQRYWGAPIPMASDAEGNQSPVTDLPVTLPRQEGLVVGENPLTSKAWRQMRGENRLRESDTFDTFMESSWYYVRYTSPHYEGGLVDPSKAQAWLPVDHYIGGIEHATMHLIYFRFFHKLLYEAGLVSSPEPVKRLTCQGMVLSEAFYQEGPVPLWVAADQVETVRDEQGKLRYRVGQTPVCSAGLCKMSKSKKNGVDPEVLLEKWGADTLRFFILFAAAPEAVLVWNPKGVEGAHRFLKRLWRFTGEVMQPASCTDLEVPLLTQALHTLIAKVTHEMEERLAFNTAIAAVMGFFNQLVEAYGQARLGVKQTREALKTVLLLLHPVVPHLTQVLWKQCDPTGDISGVRWPVADPERVGRPKVLVIQIDGKKVALIDPADAHWTLTEAIAQAMRLPRMQKALASTRGTRWVYLQGQLLNAVTQP